MGGRGDGVLAGRLLPSAQTVLPCNAHGTHLVMPHHVVPASALGPERPGPPLLRARLPTPTSIEVYSVGPARPLQWGGGKMRSETCQRHMRSRSMASPTMPAI